MNTPLCDCQCTMGLSARTIANAFGNACGGVHHPHDPSDLIRCRNYCNAHGITPAMLRERVSGLSPEWLALAGEWPELLALLAEEEPTRRAPRTYARMRELIEGSR